MERELEEFLEKATASMTDKETAEMVRLELEDHILTKAELLCLSGISLRDAVLEVLACMGNADELSENLEEVHRQPRIKAKIIYEYEGYPCRYMAQRIGKLLKIPYEPVSNHPLLYDCEILIIVKKGVYGGGVGKELTKYIHHLKKGNLTTVIFIQSYLSFASRPWRMVQDINSMSDSRGGKEGQILRKILLSKGIDSIDSRTCLRSVKLLGKIPESEMTRVITYLQKITGTYG